MSASFAGFRAAAAAAIADARLQGALDAATRSKVVNRRAALSAVPAVEALRDHFKASRAATIARLADHLEVFERQATAAGAQVHWAADGAAACRIVIDIARAKGATLAVKSKSMATEEIHLNSALAEAGIKTVETDLGEYIVQLAGETPFHIITPAIHKTRGQAAELLGQVAGHTVDADDIPALTAQARSLLREDFLAADIGISGANLGVAETGSIVLVTNEGNGRLVTSLPPVHVAIMGIEKLAPTWDDAACWLTLLARSATGQAMSVYTTVITGPRRPGDLDGPGELHIVLLDNGRSRQLGTRFEEVLQCIRCGACLNACPAYGEAGGHAYGSPYSGPIGAVVTPLLFGLKTYEALPHACSLCIACKEACPARIDLPRMLVDLRVEEVAQGIIPWPERVVERAVAFAMSHERLWRLGADLARLLQLPWARDGELRLPRLLNPVQARRLPSLAPRSFSQVWRDGDLSAGTSKPPESSK